MKKYLKTLFSFLFVFSLILTSSSSFAQTGDIDPNPSTTECVSLENNLRYRDRDSNKNGEVSTLQDFLQSKGYLNSEPTGYFGILTLKAVKDFQRSNGINPTGYVGSITRAKIVNLTCDKDISLSNTKTITQNSSNLTTLNTPNISNTNTNTPFTFNNLPTFSNLPAGCVSNQGYNTVTGKPCGNTLPENSSFKKILSNLTKEPTIISVEELKEIPIANKMRGDCENRSEQWIEVLSPKGGESYVDGQNITIRWESCGMPENNKTITYYDIYNKDNTKVIVRYISLNSPVLTKLGFVDVKLPPISHLTEAELNKTSFGKHYKIGVISYDEVTGGGYMNVSKDFFIIRPTLVLVSPNGGEVFTAGQQIEVRWKTENVPTDAEIYIKLEQSGSVSQKFISYGYYKKNDNIGIIKIPTDIFMGNNPFSHGKNFKIYISWYNYDLNLRSYGSDYSDDYFTITDQLPILQQGDVNGDGKIDCTDVSWIKETVLFNRTLTAEQRVRADMNGDGLVTTYDAFLLSQKYNLNCGTTPQPPTPTPVPDPVNPPVTGFTPTNTTLDSTPRIAYWGGKVGQHTDAQGNWISDPDGTSGVVETDAGRLTYCKKWYPNTSNVTAYKTETITTWKRSKYANDPSSYTNTVMTYKCINEGPISQLNKRVSDLSLSANAIGALDNTNTNQTASQIAPKALSETTCGKFTKILMKGMNDTQVQCLQQKLNEKGFVVAGTEGGNETIYFGYATETALKAFQIKNNLKADGIFGLQTRELFK